MLSSQITSSTGTRIVKEHSLNSYKKKSNPLYISLSQTSNSQTISGSSFSLSLSLQDDFRFLFPFARWMFWGRSVTDFSWRLGVGLAGCSAQIGGGNTAASKGPSACAQVVPFKGATGSGWLQFLLNSSSSCVHCDSENHPSATHSSEIEATPFMPRFSGNNASPVQCQIEVELQPCEVSF